VSGTTPEPRSSIEVFLEGAEEEVKEEARDILVKLGDWAISETAVLATGSATGAMRLPSGGGSLEGMSLDEALARADNLEESTAEKVKLKRERRQRAGEIVESILTAAIRILVAGGSAAIKP
jgi:hypothetical protein